MNKKTKRIFSGASSALMIASGAAQTALAETAYNVTAGESAAEYDKVANVEGRFSFNQNKLTPPDEVFNLFGTAVTGVCAKPDFALSSAKTDYYINVGGKIAYSYTVDLKEKAAQTRTMLCACATGRATANAEITGVKLADVLELAEMGEGVNIVAVRSSDGYTSRLPLRYALEKEAMIVYKVGGEALPGGTQLWVPETVAKYFTRDVVDIELLAEEEEPQVEQRDAMLRAEVAVLNSVEGTVFPAGEEITFEGYADDLGDPIAAVEFSLDGGETWTSYATEKASANRWVYWHFAYTPQEAGNYRLAVRARTAGGLISPLEADVTFAVADAEP